MRTTLDLGAGLLEKAMKETAAAHAELWTFDAKLAEVAGALNVVAAI